MEKNFSHILYHVFVVLLSAALALSLPLIMSLAGQNLLTAWAYIENEKIFLAGVEIVTAILLILLFNAIGRVRRNRKLADTARVAGLVPAAPLSRRSPTTARIVKDGRGFARQIMIIGSTGRSFSQPGRELHEALQQCREARIMLLDPREHGAIERARSIPDPEITPETIREQIVASIGFIKSLAAYHKTVHLKLYPEMPLFKMAILGNYAYVRHYHTGLNVRLMPEFVFQNKEQHGGLYMPLYRYFLSRWQDPDIPEYDLATDELVYRDRLGYEVLRERFEGVGLDDESGHAEVSRFVFR